MINLILTSQSFSRSEMEAGISLTRAFFPEGHIEVREFPFKPNKPFNHLIQIEINDSILPCQVEGIFGEGDLTEGEALNPIRVLLNQVKVQSILNHNQVGKETEKKLLLKHALFALLSEVTGHVPPWGILTGIRPSKILHRLNDLGISETQTAEILQERYAIREDKVKLIQEIVTIQNPYLEEMTSHSERAAVYVGIPFCPTRCTYCSFPAYSLERGRGPLKAYLQGLCEEIQVTGEWMRKQGYYADSLYIGGGTPTILTTLEISELLEHLKHHIPALGGSPIEFTVEAGRPDTLSREKLQALRKHGVNRLSVNPQTMHDRTLQRIGRSHTVEEIQRIYFLAREMSDWVINMDLILGLPGETVKDVQESLRQVGTLSPDNLTVHALAIKRGSKEHEAGLTQSLSGELEIMQELVIKSARSFGMKPYYLYRQKHIAGNLENIGFARPGTESRYNIGIMEERQSVIGIGAGASSKVINSKNYSLTNLQHPSNWQAYLERWKENQEKRNAYFQAYRC